MTSHHDVEHAAAAALGLLEKQAPALAVWGDAAHMAVSELCDNALQHGQTDPAMPGAYLVADRIEDPRREFRLAIADLGIGIPEHIRAQHPEWHDDSAAIGRAIERGVTGTGDPHRGNGFTEVFDAALNALLVRASSAATVDLRSARGRVEVQLVAGERRAAPGAIGGPRRGTWITYTVISV